MTLLKMSFYGAVIILAVIIIRAFTLHKLPKKTFLILWGVALLRLLVPFEIASGFSIYSLFPEREDAYTPNPTNPFEPFQNYADFLKNTEISMEENTVIADGNSGPVYLPIEAPDGGVVSLPDVDTSAQPAVGNSAAEATQPIVPAPPVNKEPFPLLPIVWGSGALLCAAFFLASYLRCRLEFSTSLPITEEYAAEWLKQHPLKRTLSIRQSDKISAPLTYGIFRPVILMPKKTDWSNQAQLNYVLYHEFTHIRRFDLAAKLVMIVALCLHWFNPFVWLMYFFFNRDLELSCDDCVIKHFGEGKSAYANTLIGMEEKKNFSTPLCNHFSKNAIEERITAIMKSKKTTIGMMLASIVIVIIVVVTLTTGRKDKEAATDVAPTGTVSPIPSETATPVPSTEPTPPPGQLVWYPSTNLYYDKDTFRCTTTTVSPELGYTFVIEKLMISIERAWSNLSIDLEPYAEGKTWSCMGVFYDADTDCSYLEFIPFPSADQELTDAGILHVTIPFDSSAEYTVTPLGSGAGLEDDVLWFSEIRKIKDRIYFNCGSCNGTLWAIDLTTNELLDLSCVNEKMQEIANALCAGFGWNQEPDIWFSASRQEKETVVYSASVCKEMDTGTIFTLQLYYEDDTFQRHTVTYQDPSGQDYTTAELVSHLTDLYDTYRSMYSLLFHSGLECGMHTHLPIEEATINGVGPYYKVLVEQFPTLQSVTDYMETICTPHLAKELRREYLHMDSDEPWLAELNGQLYTQYYNSSTWNEPVNFRFMNLSFYAENTVALDYQGYANTPIDIMKCGTIIFTHTKDGWRISSTTSNYGNPYFDAFDENGFYRLQREEAANAMLEGKLVYDGDELAGKVILRHLIPFYDTINESHVNAIYYNLDDVVRVANRAFKAFYSSKGYKQPLFKKNYF